MGQGQSQQTQPIRQREPSPEPLDPVEAERWRERRAEEERIRAEERAIRAAAVEQRLQAQQKKGSNAASGSSGRTLPKRGESALEQLSRENKGWRDADQQADLRAWN